MQTSQFSFKKSIWLLPLAITVFSLLGISSCNGKNDNTGKKDNLGPSCMTLTKDQINKNWVPTYTNPTNPEKNIISILKFYSTYDQGSGGFSVHVQAFNKSNSPLGNSIDLSSGVACGINLPPLVQGRSNDIELSALNILKPDGTLVDNFDKIILTPEIDVISGFDFLQYDVAVIVGDSRTAGPTLLPCPPCVNCKPPCPADCQPACTKDDSIRLHIAPYNIVNDSSKTK
jgi:hypothetical protein